jgi:hypothetical protein
MIHISKARDQLSDYWHNSVVLGGISVKQIFSNDDDYVAFYTAKYLIQDTADAIACHMSDGFSKDPMKAYVEVWGIMQGLIIQQDAILELYHSIIGASLEAKNFPSWRDIRELRNRCSGHPIQKSTKLGRSRSFMGRGPKYYDDFSYEEYNSADANVSHPRTNLRAKITKYDVDAASLLDKSTEALKARVKDIKG